MFESLKSILGIKAQSAYVQMAEGPSITVTKPVLTTNQKIVEACKDLESLCAKKYIPAVELTEEQKTEIENGKKDREKYREMWDLGLVLPYIPEPNTFRIKF